MVTLVDQFLKQRGLSPEIELNPPLASAIYNLVNADSELRDICSSNADVLEGYVEWAALHDMYERNYEYCSGALSCFLVGQFPSAEAICRTAIEGAVNLHYMSLGDSTGKLITYFKHHIQTERKQNRNWNEAVRNSEEPDDEKQVHYCEIDKKESALEQYEEMLRQSLAQAGVDYDSKNEKWPNIFERFKEIDDEIGYRTVYTALCSQAHNDAEDLLNKTLARVAYKVRGVPDAISVEQYHFALFMVLTSIRYHIFSSAMYIARFELGAKGVIERYDEVLKRTVELVEHSPEVIKSHMSFE